ncbi:hypothetical protein NKH36_26355 [Mesorhizobium sp. M1312]|uniref:hypothetical protein n=1 Tax=unclassified Mesorhizobium TaxID=325217 RepID=UPI00333D38A9
MHLDAGQLTQESERKRVQTTLRHLLADPKHDVSIREDLSAGLSTVPIWMQEFLRELLSLGARHEGKP